MKRGSIHVHIDELVLEGFEPAQRHQIADAVQRELTRVIEETELSGVAATDRNVERADGGAFTLADQRATTIGRGVARAVGSTVSGALGSPAQTFGTGRAR